MKPRLLDLFAGAGGSARGYQRAGFYVVGIDHKPQPRYAGDEFIQDDALDWLAQWSSEGRYEPGWGFDAIHASPPCQLWADGHNPARGEYPDLIAPVRELLEGIGLPYVIENLRRAPLRNRVMVCGGSLGCVTESGLQLHRHRYFESNVDLMGSACSTQRNRTITVVGTGTPSGTLKTLGRGLTMAEKREAMGMPWANVHELGEAIPPRYAEFIGVQLLAHVLSQVRA